MCQPLPDSKAVGILYVGIIYFSFQLSTCYVNQMMLRLITVTYREYTIHRMKYPYHHPISPPIPILLLF